MVRRHGAWAEQRRQEFAVDDVLVFGRRYRTRRLVELIATPVRMRLGQSGDLEVVLAHEERGDRDQFGVFLDPHVTCDEMAVDDRQRVAGGRL